MLIKWKGDGVVSVSPIDASMEDPAAANLIKPVLLYPGWNDVADDIWEKCRPHMVNYFAADMVEEINKKDKNEKGDDIYIGILFSDIAARKPNEATELVKNCYVKKTLEDWRDQINRPDIRNQIDDQIKKIERGYDDEE